MGGPYQHKAGKLRLTWARTRGVIGRRGKERGQVGGADLKRRIRWGRPRPLFTERRHRFRRALYLIDTSWQITDDMRMWEHRDGVCAVRSNDSVRIFRRHDLLRRDCGEACVASSENKYLTNRNVMP